MKEVCFCMNGTHPPDLVFLFSISHNSPLCRRAWGDYSDSYPPYGLYIMNRVGMDDYIQRLYPEDSVGVHGSYLMMRHYLDFTSRRLAETRSKLPLSMQDGPATKFAPEFAIADPEKLQDADKGHSQTVGLWCFATDAREPMTDVLMRCVVLEITGMSMRDSRFLLVDCMGILREICPTLTSSDMVLSDPRLQTSDLLLELAVSPISQKKIASGSL
jgi:hypothetical protein